MNSGTKNILIFSFCTLTLSVSACLFFTYEIFNKGNVLQKSITILDERSAQETAYNRIKRLVQETEIERHAIASAFFHDESDSISFLGDIENFAQASGINLSTDDLNKVTGLDGKTEYITVTFTYTGQKEAVMTFSKILEKLPFHSWTSSLSLKKNPDALWSGEQTLYITLQPS